VELQNVNVKIFAEHPEGVDQEKFTPIFHRWIQEQNCEELLIDVADYLHVPSGPGIVLIANDADYSMDSTDGRLGLRYNRKAKVDGGNAARFSQALRAALTACQRLEADPSLEGHLKFSRNEIELFVNDRAWAPNNAETRETHNSELVAFFHQVFTPHACALAFETDPRRRFGVKVKSQAPIDFGEVLKKI